MDITFEEAYSRGLPGSDVFVYTHLLYKDDINRDFGVASLNKEAYIAFNDTVLFSEYTQLAAEQRLVLNGYMEFVPTIFKRLEYINFENLKLSTGFELSLKARLLSNNCIINQLNPELPEFKELSKQQKKRPILREEYFAIDGYRYDAQRQRNRLIGLKDESLKFGIILNKPEYRKLLNIPEDIIEIADDYRNLRNQIHFPGDIIEAPHLIKYNGDVLIRKIQEFINQYIVKVNSIIATKYSVAKLCLPELSL
ncbi:hypothetical protein I8748_26500 [Nostoc sp. CENA67]|uniref:Uncharacterized protein n=1 Tax=Amazonocrinis nigriterrae CENA67 TaxID=2794033 RepID=A0A8J7HYC9_9NOST|nr:hypothetical protein [Amazonocrinis nigriterrae]MBH8565682.1 hypothetical protein [Amazonocrinis nigriterrae CENA67]